MRQEFGSEIARQWGDAHEAESMKKASARMDLHNNDVGRRIAAKYANCWEGVIEEQEVLRMSPTAEPSNASPQTPPPPPPLDQ